MSVQLTTEMITAAQDTEERFGIPASVTLGQLMLESAGSNEGGLSDLAYKYNNFFGITAGSSWTGETVQMTNKDGSDGQTYRVYKSVAASILDHAAVLLNERYTQYTKDATTVEQYVSGIANGGYATDPNYAQKVLKVIRDNNLTAYDGDSWQGKSGNFTISEEISDEEEEKSLTIWGNLLVVILCTTLIIVGIVFFIQSFSNKKLFSKKKVKT